MVLSGTSKAIQSINRQLETYSDEFMAQESGAFDYAADDCDNRTYDDTYLDYVTQRISYRSRDIISIKRTLKKAIEKQQYSSSDLQDMKATDFSYYINPKGKVIVCFGPYELGYGGWTKKFSLAGKYEK